MGQYKQSKYTGYGYGPDRLTMCGFPHFKNLEFSGEFPIATLKFEDDKFPADVKLTAFNPFIPCDSKNSSIPAGFFEIEISNTYDKEVTYQVAFSLTNPYEKAKNTSLVKDGFAFLTFKNDGADKEDIKYGDLTVATDCENTFVQTYWYRGAWMDNVVSFWNDFPKGAKKPKIPVPYCEETMTGFEYAFAGLLCSQGKTKDGFKVVKAIRDRFDGKKRNPWNEFECGSNYARSMASYALVPILSGFQFDLPRKHIGFSPYKTDKFKCIWSVYGVWGEFKIKEDKIKLKIYEGSLLLSSFGLGFLDNISKLKIDDNPVDFTFENGKICFAENKISKFIEIVL